jgi:hypothetical protein
VLVEGVGKADLARWIGSLRKHFLPPFVMATKYGFPGVIVWRGTTPSQAAKWRLRASTSPLPIAASSAVAFSTPMPGMAASRRPSTLPGTCVEISSQRCSPLIQSRSARTSSTEVDPTGWTGIGMT